MKIVFVNPPWFYLEPSADRISNLAGISYLAAVAERHGAEVHVVDALRAGQSHVERVFVQGDMPVYRIGLPDVETVRRIPEDADLVAISAPFFNLFLSLIRLTTALRDRFPNVPIIVGGGVTAVDGPRLLRELPVEMVCVGEGETVIESLVRHGLNTTCPGLYRAADPPPFLPAPEVKDLDALPMPSLGAIHVGDFASQGARRRTTLATASICTSRGCPGRCEFCSTHSVFGSHWRGHSADYVLEFMDRIVRDFGIHWFEFEDDNLLYDQARARTIFEGMVERKKALRGHLGFACPNGVSIPHLDDELIRIMSKAGCVKLVLPLEHGSKQIMRRMRKVVDVDDVVRIAATCAAHGVLLDVFSMVGYPGETEEAFSEGLDVIRRLSAWWNVRCDYICPQPYPNTPLREACLREGYDIRPADETLFVGVKVPRISGPLFTLAGVQNRIERFTAAIGESRARVAGFPSDIEEGKPSTTTALAAGKRITGLTRPEADLKGQDISCSFLRGCDLRRADARNSLWRAALVFDVNFQQSVFAKSDLTETRFYKSNLQGVDFSAARLSRAQFDACDLTGANLDDADLECVEFRDCALDNANLKNAYLRQVIVSRCQIRNADLEGSIWADARMSDNDLDAGTKAHIGRQVHSHADRA